MQFASIFTSVLVVFSFLRSTWSFPLVAVKQTACSDGMRASSGFLLRQVHTAGSRQRLPLVTSYFSRDRSVSIASSRIATVRFSSAVPNFPPMPAAQNGDAPHDGISNGSAPPPEYSPYERWVRRLYMTNMFHPVKLGLKNIELLHEAMGSPMDDPKRVVVHIAGTNGKGSVALKIAKSIELSNPNLKVGLFCSPHVSSFRERMQVNGELISEQEVVDLLPRIYKLCVDRDIPATFFGKSLHQQPNRRIPNLPSTHSRPLPNLAEITTALAFSFFHARGTDVVVLETGLGGRLDATNVVTAPAISIITSIGLEHTRILGDTIELIALEKGGIIKPGRPVLVGPNVPHAVLRKCAEGKGAGTYYTCEDVLGQPDALSKIELMDYDNENARISSAALKLLQESHPQVFGTICEDVIRKGTSERPPCRFQLVECPNGLTVILDVAHNPPAMDYLVRKLHTTYPDASFRIVAGMSSDKDLALCGKSIMQAVGGETDRIHFVQAAHPRAATLEAILEATSLFDAHYDLEERSLSRQINQAMELAVEKKEMLVVCGSVFLMAEAREALGFNEPRDSAYIAEVAGAGVRHGQENFGNSSIPVI
jgi:dihydrofolate synthase/folylpolyglutamate synthase